MKKKWIILIIILSVFLIAGTGVAIFFISSANEKTVTFDDDASIDDYKYKTTLMKTPEDGSNPSDYDSLTNIYYSLYNLEHKNAFSCTTTGTAKAAVATQIISNSRIVIGDEALVSTISDGIVKVGTQKYFINKGEKVLLRSASSINDAKASWNEIDNPECITKDSYIKRYGWLPYNAIGYIISNDTVLEASELKYENGIYETTLTLDPDGEKAPYWYRREVATNGSSTMIPEFSLIKLTYKFDSNWNILEVHAQEKYLVKSMGIKTTCETNCYDSYSYDNISFDSASYDFFQKYKDFEAVDNNDDTKIDALTLLTSSLTNKDSYESLNVNIKFNDKLVEGLASIDISDLSNVKLKVLADDLFLEYSDMLYISLGDLKIKSDTSYLKDLLNEFNGTIPNVDAIDTAAILAAFDNALIEEENNESICKVKFNLFGFDINLEYSIYKDDVDYILNYVVVESFVNGNKVEISAHPSNNKFPLIDKTIFNNLNNLDYIFEFFTKLIINKRVEGIFNINYKDINASINLKGDFNASIKLEAKININYNSNNYLINLSYIDDNIYVNYNDINLFISKDDLLNLINKYFKNDININNIDATNVIETLMILDYDLLFKNVIINDNSLELTTNLEELIGISNDIIIKLSDGEDNNIDILIDKLNINGKIFIPEDLIINKKEVNYYNLAYIESFIDDVILMTESKKINLNINALYNDIKINGNIKLDLNDFNNIKAEALINLYKDDYLQNIKITYLNDLFYIDFQGQKLSLSKEALINALSKFNIDLSNSQNILNILQSIDFNKILNSLELNENELLIGLDLNQFINGLSDLKIIINNQNDLFNINVNKYDLDIKISSFDDEIIIDGTYLTIDSILNYIDDIKSIIDSKKLEAIIDLNIKNINISGNVKLDFNDLNNIKAEALINLKLNNNTISLKIIYLNDQIYIDAFGQKLSLSKDALFEILNKFDIDLSNNNINIIDELFKLDFNSIINNFEIKEDEINLELNLSNIISSLSNLELKISKEDNILIESNLYDLKLNLKNSDFEILTEGTYKSLDDINLFIGNIKNIIDNKKLKLDILTKYKDLNIEGYALIDFNEDIKAYFNLNVLYKNISIPIEIHYLNDLIYLDYNEIHACFSINKLIDILNIKLIDPIELLFNINFEELINNIDINDDIKLNINLDYLLNDILGINLKLGNKNAKLSNDNFKLIINSDIIDELNIDIYSNFDDEIKLNNNEYINLDSLLSDGYNIYNIINNKSFRLEIESNLNINNFISLLNKDINLSGYIDFIYINALGLNIKININEIDSLIDEIINIFGIDDSKINISKDDIINKAFDVIDTLLLINENSISINLNSLFDKLSVLTIILINDNENYSLNLNMDILNCEIKIKEINNYDLVYSDDYLEYDDILNLCNMVSKILNISKNKEFNLNLDFSVYDEGNKHLDVLGNLEFKIYDNGKFDLHAKGTITQYENNITKYHILDLYLITKEYFNTLDAEDMVYITYGTVLNSESKIKIYLPLSEVLDVLGTISKLLGVDLSFLNKYSSFNFNDIDTTQVTNLIKDDILTKIIDLDKIITSLKIEEGKLDLGLNINDLLPQPENNIVSLKLDTSGNGDEIASLSLNNLYTEYHSISDNTMFDINKISLIDEEVNINVPNLDGYYNLEEIDKLINGLITTATFKDFEIEGNAKLNMLGLDLINLPINIKINVDEDGKPIIHAYIDVSSYLAKTAFGTKYLDIYFKDGYVYIKKIIRDEGIFGLLNNDGDTYYLKIKQKTFLDDIVYYLLEFGLGAKDIVMNNVNKDNGNENHIIDAGNVLNNYNHNGNEFDLGLNLEELTGNSMLGDASFSLSLEEVITNSSSKEKNLALTALKNLQVSLLGFINLNMDSLKISNIDSNGNVNSVDNTDLDTFISNYNKNRKIDVIYKNNNQDETIYHKITFVKGIAGDNIEITGKANDIITYPTINDFYYNDELYRFVGWYMDMDLKEECNLNYFDDDNHKLYAKYEKI